MRFLKLILYDNFYFFYILYVRKKWTDWPIWYALFINSFLIIFKIQLIAIYVNDYYIPPFLIVLITILLVGFLYFLDRKYDFGASIKGINHKVYFMIDLTLIISLLALNISSKLKDTLFFASRNSTFIEYHLDEQGLFHSEMFIYQEDTLKLSWDHGINQKIQKVSVEGLREVSICEDVDSKTYYCDTYGDYDELRIDKELISFINSFLVLDVNLKDDSLLVTNYKNLIKGSYSRVTNVREIEFTSMETAKYINFKELDMVFYVVSVLGLNESKLNNYFILDLTKKANKDSFLLKSDSIWWDQ